MSYAMNQLGARALHTGDDDDVEREYDRLRDMARSEADKRNECFQRSRAAYESGDGAAAKELSNEGKSHAARMDDYNRQASEFIFRENNAPGRVAADSIDLHGQFAEEAQRILEERIRADQRAGQTHLHAIVGKGNHSANHVQKVKPKVEELCAELGLKCRTEENAGRIYINLQGGEAIPPQHDGHQGGGHSGSGQPGHHEQQPHHGGQHQQPPQQASDEMPDIVARAIRKLEKFCCAVM